MTNSIKLKLYKNYIEPESKLKNVFGITVGIATLLALFFMYKLEGLLMSMTWMIILFGAIIHITIRVINIFREKKHTKEDNGIIEFNNNSIIWNSSKIDWENIADFSIETDEIKGNFIFNRLIENNKSHGINAIRIQTKENIYFNGHFLLESFLNKELLEKLLIEIVQSKAVSLPFANAVLKPKNYKEYKELEEKYKA